MRRLLVEQSSTITSLQDTYGLLLFGDIQSLDNYIYSLTYYPFFLESPLYTAQSWVLTLCGTELCCKSTTVELSLLVMICCHSEQIKWRTVRVTGSILQVKVDTSAWFSKELISIIVILCPSITDMYYWHVWLTVSWSSPSSFKAAVC